jgi:hypothetical protein
MHLGSDEWFDLTAEDHHRRMLLPTPFPGMDPYLEHPALWPSVHNGLIAALQLSLAPQLRPHYYVALEERLYITEPDQRVFVGRPDAAVIGQLAAEPALKPTDQEPAVDLGLLLHDLYDRASYDLRLDYRGHPDPPLPAVEAAWVDELLHQYGLR